MPRSLRKLAEKQYLTRISGVVWLLLRTWYCFLILFWGLSSRLNLGHERSFAEWLPLQLGHQRSVAVHVALLCSYPHWERLSFTVRCNVTKTVALKAPYRFWNALFGFKVQVPYPDFRGKFRLNKMEDCGRVPQDICFSMFIFETFDVFDLFMQRC